MRKLTSLAAVAALFSAAMLLSAPSQAMTPGTASRCKAPPRRSIRSRRPPAGATAGTAGAGIRATTATASIRTYGYGYGYGYRRWGYWRLGGGYGYRRWHYSDVNLKHDIVPVGHLANGLGLYRFSYTNSDKVYVGVLAQEVARVMPDAVRRAPNGYLQVNYARIGVPMMTWDQWVEAGQRH